MENQHAVPTVGNGRQSVLVGSNVVALDHVPGGVGQGDDHAVRIVARDDIPRGRRIAADRVVRGVGINMNTAELVAKVQLARNIDADIVTQDVVVHGWPGSRADCGFTPLALLGSCGIRLFFVLTLFTH